MYNTQNGRPGVDEIQHENIGSNMTSGQIWPISGSFYIELVVQLQVGLLMESRAMNI
jgi:hypothetical protein